MRPLHELGFASWGHLCFVTVPVLKAHPRPLQEKHYNFHVCNQSMLLVGGYFETL
jgi:hypothetical protein